MNKFLKSTIAFLISCSAVFSAVACGGDNTTGGIGQPLSAAELGAGFKEEYLPDASKIRQYSGKIDVCLDFEGTQEGWKALAAEYQRLQGGSVIVNVNTNYAGSVYADRLNNELTNPNTDWDIVEGNLGYGSTRSACIDMYPSVSSPNAYCGKDKKWIDVLQSAAYKTKEADNSGECYIMNTEVMQTCWFVNDVAFAAAVEKGYLNADGKAEYPITWDDLINLCVKMEEADYTNPLGITLCNASIESLQFTWLLRVYGDYYYRQFYQYVMGGTAGTIWEEYDPTAEVPEAFAGYGAKFPKILNMMFDKDCAFGDGYVGFTSEVYRDFVGQLSKMKGHLMKDNTSTEFSALRDEFETQSRGKSSPQILLDYQGFGINYEGATTEAFAAGYFDYPQMISSKYTSGELAGEYIVDPETITRDIGGNGGFVSVINHVGDSAQNEMNKDFVKFVMSPYGQTIFYKGLAGAGAVPKGLTSVKNELVVIPDEWKTFFAESGETVTFSGDVDANPFLSWGVRYANGFLNTQKVICEYWRNLLKTDIPEKQQMSVDEFCVKWGTAVEQDRELMLSTYKWPSNVWMTPDYNL